MNVKKWGNRYEVYYGHALYTRGKLTRDDFIVNKRGCVVSLKLHEAGKKRIYSLHYGLLKSKGLLFYKCVTLPDIKRVIIIIIYRLVS